MCKLYVSIAICLSSLCSMMTCRAFTTPMPTRQQKLSTPASSSSLLFVETSLSTTSRSLTEDEEDDNTVVTISNPKTGQTVTLIGTAHLSEKSNQQVQRLIETLQPNAVMIEIDPSRLERLGFDSADDIKVAKVTDSEDIELPMAPRKTENGLMGMAQKAFVGVFSQGARLFLTQMYKSLENGMDQKAGGEFLQAIYSAENCTVCDTVILGDRNSVTTIQRVAELAIESGDFMGVLNRLQAVNKGEMEKLEPIVRKELLQQKGQEGNDDFELDEVELTTAIMETLKEDEQFRTRLFARLEQDVPEFTQAFLKERDYLMSESIRRELDRRPEEVKTVVGVVGLAHVPGMTKHFKTVFANEPAPLVQEIANAAAE
jgi:pheromone shutdown protein TraB